MSSYIEYLRDKRIISYVIVERDSNVNQTLKTADNNVNMIDVVTQN